MRTEVEQRAPETAPETEANKLVIHVVSAFYDRRNSSRTGLITIRTFLLSSRETSKKSEVKIRNVTCISNGVSSKAFVESPGTMNQFTYRSRDYRQFVLSCRIKDTKWNYFHVS